MESSDEKAVTVMAAPEMQAALRVILADYSDLPPVVFCDDLAAADFLAAPPLRLGALIDSLRQAAQPQAFYMDEEVAIGPYVMDPVQNILKRDDSTKVTLTEKERDILWLLHQAAGQAVSRDDMLAAVWGYSEELETHTLETHIYRLRQKIEADPANPVILITDENGYRLAVHS